MRRGEVTKLESWLPREVIPKIQWKHIQGGVSLCDQAWCELTGKGKFELQNAYEEICKFDLAGEGDSWNRLWDTEGLEGPHSAFGLLDMVLCLPRCFC